MLPYRPENLTDKRDPAKDFSGKLLMKQVRESPNKTEIMVELFPKNDAKEYQKIAETVKNILEELGNIEAHEMFMITDAIQCQTCYHYWTCTYCRCEAANPGLTTSALDVRIG